VPHQRLRDVARRRFGGSFGPVAGASAPAVSTTPDVVRPQAESRFRPFRRRLAITRRPPTVAIRLRKPWRRLRTNLLGW